MSHRATIQGIMRQVPKLMGETVTVRTRTSNAGATVTWSATQELTAQIGQDQESVEHDHGRGTDVRKIVAVMIYDDTYTFALQGAAITNELPIGAEVIRAGFHWAVVRRLQATSGLKRCLLERGLPRQITADRGGRVQ